MASEGERDGPLFVWTFPLISRFQKRSGILNIGQGASTVSSKVNDVRQSSPVRNRVSDALTDDEEDEETNELEDELEELQENSEAIFGEGDSQDDDGVLDYSQGDSTNLVEMDDDVFIPLRLEIEEGEEVTWENNDDRSHRILSSDGDEVTSDQIGPGETFSHTFRNEGVTRYFDTIVGGDTMCGAIIVGDAELDEPLRCEQDIARELFSEKSEMDKDSGRTMSSAVEDKESMDVGF